MPEYVWAISVETERAKMVKCAKLGRNLSCVGVVKRVMRTDLDRIAAKLELCAAALAIKKQIEQAVRRDLYALNRAFYPLGSILLMR